MASKLYPVVRLALCCRRGAALVEYALLAALIAIVAITALTSVGSNTRAKFNSVAASV